MDLFSDVAQVLGTDSTKEKKLGMFLLSIAAGNDAAQTVSFLL